MDAKRQSQLGRARGLPRWHADEVPAALDEQKSVAASDGKVFDALMDTVCYRSLG
jgi:hypothetical protein